MKNSTSPIKILRAALLLLTLLLPAAAAMATDFITDVMVVGNKNQTDFNSLINSYVSAGWTDINYDLNSGSGSSTDYIHLLFKKQSSSGNTGTPITDFYIRTGNNPPSSLTHEGRTYYLVPYDGSTSFINSQGDLNNNAGGAYIHLYYTKDALTNNHGVTGISFNTSQSGAVGENGGSTGYDLNSGAGGAYIYMHLATTSGGNVVTLTSGSGNVQLLNGHILTGTGGADTQVSVTDGATVTFNGVNLTAITNNSSHSWPGIHCLGNATIVLNGSTSNSVKGGYFSPGIYVAANKTLTIQGSGTLTATGRDYAAGIGSGQSQSSCGNITISGGTVTAAGGQNAAGIGSGAEQQSCGNITISGGTVNATGLTWAAGIGSGSQSSCGTITLSGGTVTATGGLYAAAIGSGYQSSCGNITITNGVTRVTATKHNNSAYSVGASNNGSSVTVTIGGVQTGSITMSPFVTYPYTVHFDANGGTGTMANQAFMYNVSQSLTGNAFTNGAYPFLGWATTATGPKVYNNGQSVSNLTQTAGATVTLYAKWGKTVTLTSSTGEVLLQNGDTLTGTGGSSTRVKIADGATVTFSGVNNIAISNDSDHSWPGIHCLGNATIVLNGNTTNSVKGGYFSPGIYVAANKTLTIQGSGTLNATGQARGAGIGSGYQSSCGNITINSGTVNAIGGYYAAGIGSGCHHSSCGAITINGGTVNATGGYYAAGIGSGCHHSSCGAITISGGTVTATGDERAAAIGSGYEYSSCSTITISGGTVTANGGYLAAAIGSGYYFASCGDITITNGVTRVTATKHINSTNTVGAGDNRSTCGTITIGNVQQTEFITMSPFETYPYTVHFDANGGTGTMNDQALMNNVAQNLRTNTFTNAGLAFQGWATSATGPTVYDNGQSVSHLTDTIATVTLYAKWTLPVNGNTYTINNPTGWDIFCNMLAENDNGYFTGKTVKLADSISVTTMAGSSGHEFSGTFDGQSHTLTVNYQNTDSTVRTAPFSYVNGATIRNLIVAGSITGTGHCAGIVGETGSSLSHITNCVSSVNVSGGNTAGISMGGNVEIAGCVFNGTITSTSISAGFVGSYNSTLVIGNSLFAPQAGSSISSGTFCGGDITPVNSYYTMPLGTLQGKQARSIEGGEHVTVAFHGEATAYNTSGISAYSVGIVYDNTLYAGNGETVSLNLSCTPPSGYVLSGYTTSAGTLTGSANPYTLTMPNEDVTIQAMLEQLTPVAYIDENGVEQQCTSYTEVTNDLNFNDLPAGWYVVNNSITIDDQKVYFTGDAHLILCDSATMNISCEYYNALYADGSLTLYGQSEGTGSLTATSNSFGISATNLTINGGTVTASGSNFGIYANNLTITGSTVTASGSNEGIHAHNLTINGSTVTASGSEYGISASRVTITGNTVTASGSSRGIGALWVTINSGTVNATGNNFSGISIGNASGYVTINGGTVNTNRIYSPTVTLGWSNINDRITVDSLAYYSTPTVSVKSGQAFYYIGENGGEKQAMDTVVISGTLTPEEIAAIEGKTLAPYTLPPVAYIDENGVEQQCTFYTVVTNNLDFDNLPAGWYVVNDSITINSWVYFSGDAHLILCDNTTMNISVSSGDALYADISLTLYGQSKGTGSLTATSDNNSGICAPNLTINSSTVTATGSNEGEGIIATDLIINGSTVTATGSDEGILASDLTINGSTINATGNDYGIYAIDLTINGGTVNATGNNSGISIGNASGYVTINGGTVTTNEIYSPSVTLGWSNTNDSISVGNFAYSGTPTVSVKSGQSFYYIDNEDKHVINTAVISGTLTSGEIAAIAGKTLRPYIEPCTPPFHLEVSDISATTATLHWMGVQDSYIVRYRTLERAGEWVEATADTTTLNLTNLVPETLYEWQVRGVNTDCNGGVTDWSETATFTTEELTTVTQTIELAAGTNWCSFNVEIALDDLQTALTDVLGTGNNVSITIQSQTQSCSLKRGRWTGSLASLDVAYMYKITVSSSCEIALEGAPVNPANHPVTIVNGDNWIAFPFSESMTLTEAFAGFAANNDIVTGQIGSSKYTRGNWRGGLTELEPGQGFIYNSSVQGERTFTFPTGAK